MKRSYVVMVALLCLALGAAISHLTTRRAKAQSGQVGRYQLFQGKYLSVAVETNGVFRIDTVTGKTDGYFAGKNKEGFIIEGWASIPTPMPMP